MPSVFCLRARRLLPVLALAAVLATPAIAQNGVLRDGVVLDSIQAGDITLYKIHRVPKPRPYKGPMTPSFDGDSYSFDHQLGAFIDDIFQCFSEQQSGMDDNTVLFDGLSELLDPYLDGTDPFVFEFESPGMGPGERDAFFNSFSGNGGDLFPEGFDDPATGTPLTDACIEIGIDDTLDSDIPSEVTEATIEMSDSDGTVIPQTDITSFFSQPFDGRLSIVFSGGAGQGINGTVMDITIKEAPFDEQPIFSDGFESGDASAWSDQVP